MGLWLQQLKNEGLMDTITQAAFDHNLNQLSNIVGGCERIASTPIPFPYSVLLHRTVYIYCCLLPFGLVDSIGWMTPLIVAFIGYTFIALDAIVNEIEEPFGEAPNDLALNTICQTIETSLLEMLGQEAPAFPPSTTRYVAD
jgi:putative membrane protein